MSPELPEKLLGIDIEDPSERRPTDATEADETELERFVYVSLGDLRLAIHVDDVKTITDPPEDATRIPRSPDAIEGVVDIRGEVTVVIEPRVHFPVPEDPAARQRLLVFDRPTDEQPAGIRVDDVLGVETVAKADVLDSDDEDSEAFEHPLVVGIVERTRREGGGRSFDAGDSTAPGEAPTDNGESAVESPLTAARRRTSSEEFDVPVSDVEDIVEEESERSPSRTADVEEVVERTALVDVDRLLLASGPVE